MAIYRRGKTWWYSFTFNGERVQKSTKVENRREAENIERAAWTQLARGEVGVADKPEAERKTLAQLLDALVEDFKTRGKASAKNLSLIAIVKADLGEHYADAFRTRDVTAYIANLRKPQKSKKKERHSKSLADSTIKHRLQVLSSAYELENAAREDEDFEPLRVPRFPELSDGNERSGFLSRAQFDVLQSYLPDDLKDYCLFAYLVGWRKSAVAGLEWLDVRDGNIYLRGVLSKNRKPYFVPILGELIPLIERRKEARSIKTDSAGVLLSSLVFHRAGEPIREFRKSWATACKAAGCPGNADA